MSADPSQLRERLSTALSNLDQRLSEGSDQSELLRQLATRIDALLAEHGGAEPHLREALEEHYARGNLRPEIYRCVLERLDHYRSEHAATLPDAQGSTDSQSFSETTVLPDGLMPVESSGERAQIGSLLRDRYMLQERVAGGSMGEVYKALDRRLAESGADTPWVAIKILSAELAQSAPALRALQQEAAKGRRLTHSNIVRFIDLDRDDDLYFIVMEWLEGRTLADILDAPESNSFDHERALKIVHQIGQALAYAHRCGIVHADVKPGNIMLLPNGDAKLFDFGVARVRQTQEAEGKPFDPGVLGAVTPAYSSMQVLTGEEPAPADDVFSLACLYYRLVAGYRVFGPRNAAEAADAGMTPQQPANLPDDQWPALKKALSYSRVTRFESMNAFLEALGTPTEKPEDDNVIRVDPGDRLTIDEPSRSSAGIWLGLLLLIGGGAAAWQFGALDAARDWLADMQSTTPAGIEEAAPVEVAAPAAEPAAVVEDSTPPAENATATTTAPVTTPSDAPEDAATAETASEAAVEVTDDEAAEVAADSTPVEDAPSEPVAEVMPEEAAASPVAEVEEPVQEPEPAPEPAEPIIDFSRMPPADYELPLRPNDDLTPVILTLREDWADRTLDLFRTDSLSEPLVLLVEEIDHSGNRSPWASAQYVMTGGGRIRIPARQDRARVTLSMARDPVREADQHSLLSIRDAATRRQLALVRIELEDDDQRNFERSLPPDTIGFAVSQVAVHERDSAVQIDVLRYNPGSEPLVIGYALRDITATGGEDYVAPSGNAITFAPGQRSARLLIPLVQDYADEGDEAFTIELATDDLTQRSGVFTRMVVRIRDDEIRSQ